MSASRRRLTDVAPTLLTALGLPPLETATGRTLVEALRSGGSPASDGVREWEVAVAGGGRLDAYRQAVRLARVGGTIYVVGGRSSNTPPELGIGPCASNSRG